MSVWVADCRAGVWLDSCRRLGIEGEYLALEDQSGSLPGLVGWRSRHFTADYYARSERALGGRGSQSWHRDRGVADCRQCGGHAPSNFQSAGARLRLSGCCQGSDCTNFGDCGVCGCGRRIDWIIGYRYLHLVDQLGIREELTTTNYNNPDPTQAGSFLVQDGFQTRNEFHGGELGMAMRSRRGRWSLDVIPKIALGNTHETVMINGSTVITDANRNTTTYEGGLLALKSNIGTYQNDAFAVVPEIGLNLGYQLTPHLSSCLVTTSSIGAALQGREARSTLTSIRPGFPPAIGNPTSPQFVLPSRGFLGPRSEFRLGLPMVIPPRITSGNRQRITL